MHVPVLLHECMNALQIEPEGIYVDATYGGGGHSREILNRLGEHGRLVVFDQDEDAKERLIEDPRILFVNENFVHIQRFLKFHGIKKVDGILADIGVSSFQLDSEERGFSTRFEAKLDMRMRKAKSKTAADILNDYSAQQLWQMFQDYGELRNAKTLANKIVDLRREEPFQYTQRFIERIQFLIKGNRNRYLAQVFQALRIEVNEEMEALKGLLVQGADLLNDGGRLAVITFHSLEDRIVKNFFKTGTFDGRVEKDVFGNFETPLKLINKKPILPTEEELAMNSRSRSAKLRIAEK